MDVDILKPNTGFLTVERPSGPSTSNSASHSKTASERHVSSGSATPETPDDERARIQSRRYAEPVSEGEEDEDMDMAPARDEGKRMGLSVEEAAGAIAFRERMLKERMSAAAAAASSSPGNGRDGVASDANGAGEGPSAIHSEDEGEDGDGEEEGDERTPFLAGKNRRASRTGSNQNGSGNGTVERSAIKLNINPLAPSTEVYDKVKTALEARELEQNRSRSRSHTRDGEQHDGEGEGEGEDGADLEAAGRSRAAGDDRILVNDVVAPKGKRVAIPIRIEPKVYFATERTFLVSFSTHAPSSHPRN